VVFKVFDWNGFVVRFKYKIIVAGSMVKHLSPEQQRLYEIGLIGKGGKRSQKRARERQKIEMKLVNNSDHGYHAKPLIIAPEQKTINQLCIYAFDPYTGGKLTDPKYPNSVARLVSRVEIQEALKRHTELPKLRSIESCILPLYYGINILDLKNAGSIEVPSENLAEIIISFFDGNSIDPVKYSSFLERRLVLKSGSYKSAGNLAYSFNGSTAIIVTESAKRVFSEYLPIK
jgi:hypothetical protein